MRLSRRDGRRNSTKDHVVQRQGRAMAAFRWGTVATVLGLAGATLWASTQPAAFEESDGREIAGGPAAYADNADRPVEPALGIPSARPRIVELYQDHCPACERTKVQVDRLRRDCAGRQVEILAINADDSRNAGLLEHLGVDLVPTFILLTDDGREAGRLVGAPELSQLRQAAASLMNQTCAGQTPAGRETTDDENIGAGCADPPPGPWDEHDPHPLLEATDEICWG